MPCLGAYAPSEIQSHAPLITSWEHEPLPHSAWEFMLCFAIALTDSSWTRDCASSTGTVSGMRMMTTTCWWASMSTASVAGRPSRWTHHSTYMIRWDFQLQGRSDAWTGGMQFFHRILISVVSKPVLILTFPCLDLDLGLELCTKSMELPFLCLVFILTPLVSNPTLILMFSSCERGDRVSRFRGIVHRIDHNNMRMG